MKNVNISSERELEFVLFCIDFVSQQINPSPNEIYQLLSSSGLLNDYLVANYDVLHTLSKGYLVDDIIRLMKERDLL